MRKAQSEEVQRGVVRRLAACERTERERRLLRLLAAGEGEIAVGVGHTLASVMKEADAILGAGPV